MGLKILMADDEREVLEIMAEKIGDQGYEVVTARDGIEAWEKIQRESPDVILLDLTMPKMDGFEVLRALREHPSREKWQPVIIISARGELEDLQRGISMEAEHYLVKPCSIGDILKAIRLMAKLIPRHKIPSEIEDGGIEIAE